MTASALAVLRALHRHTSTSGMPPPAALIGDWADADAIIAPSIDLVAGVAPPDVPDRFWLGYLGFPVRGNESELPETVGGLTDAVLVLRDGRWEYRDVRGRPTPSWVDECLRHPIDGPADPWSARWTAPDRAAHIKAVESCLEAIRAGEVYQACVCTAFTGELDGAPIDFYADLTAATRPAKSAFLQGDWGSVASMSPETFLRRTGNIVTSSPIKGTIPAHLSPEILSASTKDIAENIMIVDLVRNDLGRVAVTGSVRVPELLSVIPAPGVWHLVSTVEAIVEHGTGNEALIDATFPPASVTGTPKLRAIELLAEWESTPRGVYCGAIGLAGPDGLLDLNVAIRTVTVGVDGHIRLGVGGGITSDSEPAREWQECLDKAATIVGRSSV